MAEKKRKKRYLIFSWKLWGIILVLLLIPVALVALTAAGAFGELPDTKKLENPEQPVASQVYSSDGVLLGKYFEENRTMVDFNDLSPNLVDALVATEDARFEDHAGIDWWSLSRAVIKTGILRQNAGGASTVSQQLAKNLFPRGEKLSTPELIIKKIKENILAVRLERLYTKNEIIAMYFNTVDFGHQAVGIKSAAFTFFAKDPSDLNPQEAALLVGMLKAPTYYSPKLHPERAKGRRNTVLAQMAKYDKISESRRDSLQKIPLEINYNVETHNEGLATYFREHLRPIVKKWAEAHGYDIYRDGLRIYTTIDSRWQQYAEEATWKHMKELQGQFFKIWRARNKAPWHEHPEIIDLAVKRSERYRAMRANEQTETQIMSAFNKPRPMKVFSYYGERDTVMSPLDSIKYYKWYLHTGFMVQEPNTGQVKAWVGGVNYKYFKYDHVTGSRQVGSTFKPFVYATAITNDYSPCQKYPNTPIVFTEYNNWTPKNADGSVGGEMTLRSGLKNSVNLITARLVKDVGIENVVQLSRNLGITAPMEPTPALSLGTADIPVHEMVGAFNAFNSAGMYHEPVLILRIEDKNGRVLETPEFLPKSHQAMSEEEAYIMVDMLKSVVNGGTGYRMRFRYNIRGPLAGKTGTTQNQSDGWFMCMAPQLTGGIWVGAEERAIHFPGMSEGQGASMALPIMGYFMQRLYEDDKTGFDKNMDWAKPRGELGVELDCSRYETEQEDLGKTAEDELLSL